jgi:hypothetical protein
MAVIITEDLDMESLPEYLDEYKKQLKKGYIQEAYKGLMEYIMNLRTHLKNEYPDYIVSTSVYYGYMDMTYFAFFPESFKIRGLKIAIVFIHDKFKFETWLAGYNKQFQQKYWELIKENNWNKYHIVPTTKNVDSILEYTLADNPDFSDLDALTRHIEKGTLNFINDIEGFLSKH